ncbi:hypothetical protein M514_14590, partial [Trichuris suis]
IRCIKGKYPRELLESWDNYALNGFGGHDRPDSYTEDQHYVVLFVEYAGDRCVTLQQFYLQTAKQPISVLRQVAVTLCILEKKYKFEHRDLHLGNILVRRAKTRSLNYIIDGQPFTIKLKGVRCFLMDFTLSRIEMGDKVHFINLSSISRMFSGEGDDHFDVYRSMRDVVGTSWANFNPKTNVLWLEYLIDYFSKTKCRGAQLPLVRKEHLLNIKRSVQMCISSEEVSFLKVLFPERHQQAPIMTADVLPTDQ